MEFHDEYPSYETLAQHDAEHGKAVRKVIWKVFWIMLIVTLTELFVGFKAEAWHLSGLFTKTFFISFTLVKAGYIVLSFMHLGDEEKALKWVILAPYMVLVLYLIIMVDLGEGTYSKKFRTVMDHNVVNSGHHSGGGEAAEHEGGEHH